MNPSKPACFLHQTVLALGSVFSFSMLAHGQGSTGGIPGYPASVTAYDSREVTMLPGYCIYTQSFRERVPGGNDPAKIEYWSAVMGKSSGEGPPLFSHMHHYCWGLMKTNRAIVLARTRTDRMSYLAYSLSEFDYVIERAPKDFFLLPEILTKKGENLLRLGRVPLGIKELTRAIELKPDYWPPYADLSDHFKETGDLKNARELLVQGLSFAPDAKALQRRLAELDSAKSKPKAAARPDKSARPAKSRPEK